MPIKNLSETVRLPRLGKIHLGTKHPEKGYPMKADHFIFPEDHADYGKLVELFGKTPKKLSVFIPVEDEDTWASQYYKSYNLTFGLVCKGDGELATRMQDVKTGELPTANKAGTVALQEIPCKGTECPEYLAKKCHEVMNLRFILPEIPGLGVWQIDTGSKNSILNINSCAKIIKRAFGRISMIPLSLTFEPMQVNNPDTGKKQTVYVLNLRTDVTMAKLAEAARESLSTLQLKAPDLEEAFQLEVEKDIEVLWPDDRIAKVDTATGVVIDAKDMPPEDLLFAEEVVPPVKDESLISQVQVNALLSKLGEKEMTVKDLAKYIRETKEWGALAGVKDLTVWQYNELMEAFLRGEA
uniref:Uncharacterized protein n=1 Tax=viral metagenome TaxID=1070528 RepID=A0A6M3J2M9_9ZZZZ